METLKRIEDAVVSLVYMCPPTPTPTQKMMTPSQSFSILGYDLIADASTCTLPTAQFACLQHWRVQGFWGLEGGGWADEGVDVLEYAWVGEECAPLRGVVHAYVVGYRYSYRLL